MYVKTKIKKHKNKNINTKHTIKKKSKQNKNKKKYKVEMHGVERFHLFVEIATTLQGSVYKAIDSITDTIVVVKKALKKCVFNNETRKGM